ncbi:MAG: histidine--tRNA ligase [Candidatus Bathyarchaeota archaeon]|nr:MAG: histidine--tRNA ligase [Candidatus Bathyarchaeota archaeon]
MARFQTIKGMRDFLPKDAEKLRYVRNTAMEIARLYSFEEIITPVVEHYDLLTAKSGEEIKARMYSFEDLGGRKVALRPEFTASIARLMATSLRNEPKPLKLYSSGTLYRYDEPQFGRYREFWQSNFEIIGSNKPEADAEIIILTDHFMKKLGLSKYLFKIGHVGIMRGLLSQEGADDEQQNRIMQLLDAKRWKEALATSRDFGVSEKSIDVMKHILETKGEDPSKVLPRVEDQLRGCAGSLAATENLQEILGLCRKGGADFEVLVEAGFARGLEYYTGMIFEILVPEMNISIGGGGRYDKLVELFGGEPTPSVGVAHGLDRTALAMENQKAAPRIMKKTVSVIPVNEDAVPKALETALRLRKSGIAADVEVMRRTVSRALQDADRRKSAYALILGPKEIKEGKLTLRDLKEHKQYLISLDEAVRKLLQKK